MGATVGRSADPPNRPVPPISPISSRGGLGSTRTCGGSNWISRTLNGSLLKRALRVHPWPGPVKTREQQQRAGGILPGNNAKDATRDGESRQAQAKVFASTRT